MAKAGRKEKPINWELVELYLKSGCTQKKICEKLFICTETLNDRVKSKYGMDYSDLSASLRSEGEMLIEAAQFQKAIKGNSQMLIWLGKVRLGQREPEPSRDIPLNDELNVYKHRIMMLEAENDELREKNKS